MDLDPDPGPAGVARHERYIRAEPDRRLVIEVDSVPGAEPREAVELALVEQLTSLLDKPDGITIVHDDVIASRGAGYAWGEEDLAALATETFDGDSTEGTVTMHVMWLDGQDAESAAILGLAWDNRHIVMYHDQIESGCASQVLLREQVCVSAQLLVWLHEVGHTIGLVDNGLPMVEDHRDPDHGQHDINTECLMYWAFEGQSGINSVRDRLLAGSTMQGFDAQCLADVAAVRDRP